MKIVIYARYSSHSQSEQSIEGQLQTCYEYARLNGHIVVGEYTDRAQTGTTDSRTEVLCCKGCSISAPTLQHGNHPFVAIRAWLQAA